MCGQAQAKERGRVGHFEWQHPGESIVWCVESGQRQIASLWSEKWRAELVSSEIKVKCQSWHTSKMKVFRENSCIILVSRDLKTEMLATSNASNGAAFRGGAATAAIAHL